MRSLKLSVMNLFDTGHTEVYEPTIAQVQASKENQHTSQMGRSAVLTLQWDF
ncbi:MAG: hypothetical protein HRU15_04910 [Planctomycetes bacterium]|nr:hypothetical protein [Planctomycetota bacterium]